MIILSISRSSFFGLISHPLIALLMAKYDQTNPTGGGKKKPKKNHLTKALNVDDGYVHSSYHSSNHIECYWKIALNLISFDLSSAPKTLKKKDRSFFHWILPSLVLPFDRQAIWQRYGRPRSLFMACLWSRKMKSEPSKVSGIDFSVLYNDVVGEVSVGVVQRPLHCVQLVARLVSSPSIHAMHKSWSYIYIYIYSGISPKKKDFGGR